MIKYLSVSEYCKLHGLDPGNVRRYIASGRIEAVKIGNQWAIPEGTPPPTDKRVKSGKYVDWRKDKGKDGNQPPSQE